MKQLLFLVMMLGIFIACSDDDDQNNELPIKGLEIPKFENPVKPGESVTIKGEGFTQASEIWFRPVITRTENKGDIKAIVTDVNATGITFTTPEVYGNQSVLLKENGKEYELGKMTFEEQPTEEEDVEILPKKISKIIFHETEEYTDTYEYTYNTNGQITLINMKLASDEPGTTTYTYSDNKINIETYARGGAWDETITLTLKNGKLSHYKSSFDEYSNEFTYIYNGEYLSEVTGTEETPDNEMSETYTFIAGKLIHYNYTSQGDSKVQDYTYGNQLNNLNLDLWAFISILFDSDSVSEAFLSGIAGKRPQYLPDSMKETYKGYENGEDNYTFKYKMNGDYITEMSIVSEPNEEGRYMTWRWEIFYED